MALKDSFQTHIIGSILDVGSWEVSDWIRVIIRLLILGGYVLVQTLISFKIFIMELFVSNPITQLILNINGAIWSCIPIFGKYGKKIVPRLLSIVQDILIPNLKKLEMLVKLSFQLHLVEMTLKDKKNVQIFVTAESDDLEIYDSQGNLKTTLILANHRSLNDYMLINYLIQNCSRGDLLRKGKKHILKKSWQENEIPIPRLNFITWGKIVNFPHLSLMKNILMMDENAFVPPTKIKNHLTRTGNQVLTIFPEVNIMTTELSIVQRKLNQDYPFGAKFYNVLYPRFKTFISTIKCFAYIKHVKLKEQNGLLSNARHLLTNGVDKIILKAQSKHTNEEENAQASMIVDLPNFYETAEMTIASGDVEEPEQIKEPVVISQDLYDLTMIYYKPRYTNVGHDHINGQFTLHDGYQLEQVNPSIFEMLKPEKDFKSRDDNYTCSKPPIVIMIHIRKHELGPLLPAKGRNLEKWLESQWLEKDKMIDSIENGIKIK